jgi:hypothetical protein
MEPDNLHEKDPVMHHGRKTPAWPDKPSAALTKSDKVRA